ncbi:MAG: helix-turn-helix domain-containing protein [Rickettsiales bacterium]|jgi:probable addiction module antidote protein|nr:helix-turn-helix domain-containing protein [Rickettsiales bacterium]
MKDCPIPMETDSYKLESYEDFIVRRLKKDPELAARCLEGELVEYLETREPIYLQRQLREIVRAFGYCNFERKTGLTRRSIYNIVNGKTTPKFETILKFIDALGYSISYNLTKKTASA